ncbi:MAG: chromate transporter [Clostridiales bacterium]|nr:chromate transporter [Clostridiales bacterium]
MSMNAKKSMFPSPRLLVDLFLSFAKISLFTVGGGYAMVPLVADMATEKRGWLTEEEMMDCLTVAQSLPGGVIVNMSTYIGKKVGGVLGMLAAVVGVVFPTATLAVIIGVMLGNIGDNVYAMGAVQGAKAAAVGLVLAVFIKTGKAFLKGPLHWVIAVAVVAVILFWQISAIWLIVAGGTVGWIAYKARKARAAKTERVR